VRPELSPSKPTAVHELVEAQATPFKIASWAPVGFGGCWMDQLAPALNQRYLHI
jgi:hypothetical protein